MPIHLELHQANFAKHEGGRLDAAKGPTSTNERLNALTPPISTSTSTDCCGPPRPQQIRAIILGRLDKMNDMKYMTPTGTHRDGGPFGISLESLAAQGVSLETGALCGKITTQPIL